MRARKANLTGAALVAAAAAALVWPGRAAAAGLSNPGFEQGLQGWTATGAAFELQPVHSTTVSGSRVAPVSVGGDYWADLGVPIGVRGEHWIGTFESRGDVATGTLTSAGFTIPADAAFLSFLIGGGNDAGALRIELLVVSGGTLSAIPGITPKTGLDSELLRRDWWSIGALDKTQEYAIRITDAATGAWGHLNVDDLRFERTDPSTTRRADGRPSLLRTRIRGAAVWTDYDAELWGAADLHTHLMSHLSMGGKLMHGAPDVGSLAPPGTINQGSGCNSREIRTSSVAQALSSCNATHGGWGIDNTCGDSIRAATINLAYDTENVHKIKLPHEASCAPGMEMDAGLCYPRCKPGYHGLATMCHKDCPSGFRDDSFHCAKPAAYPRGTGFPIGTDIYSKASHSRGNGYSWDPTKGSLSDGKDRCRHDHPSGCQEGSPSIWYPKCKKGYTSVGALCWERCRPHYNDDGLTCRRDGLEVAKESCEREHPQGCERYGLIYYPKCKRGFHAFECCICTPDCPPGMVDIGVSCQKNGDYSRGIGKPPQSNVHGDHQHAGYPAMAYWPHWSTKSHQQMYVDWIRRAHEGGLNVLVALAVNNELLGEVVNGGPPKGDRASADKQIDEIHRMIGRHSDFMREVQTAAELRQAVKEGKLAVVVGIEVDNLGGFNVGNPTLLGNEAAVRREIQRLYHEKKVRYVFPLHFADNVFGGVAVKGGIFNLSNRFARLRPLPIGAPYPPGFLYDIETARDQDITLRLAILGADGEWAVGLTFTTAKATLDGLATTPFPPAFHALKCPVPVLGCLPQFKLLSSILSPDPEWDGYQLVSGGHVNRKGLTPVGEVALTEMMRLGMFIDIDHMSDKAANRTLEIASRFDYPVNSGHTGFRHRPSQKPVDENSRTAAQLRTLGRLGGMMGIGWAGADALAFLRNYRWGREHGTELCTSGSQCTHPPGPAFSLGSDINGFEEMPRPRQGANVVYCKDADAACWRATPGALRQYAFGTTSSGQPRYWDYNTEGVAHIGLYPDIYQDLKDAGMTAPERQEFFGAAEAFARMWDKIEVKKTTIH